MKRFLKEIYTKFHNEYEKELKVVERGTYSNFIVSSSNEARDIWNIIYIKNNNA